MAPVAIALGLVFGCPGTGHAHAAETSAAEILAKNTVARGGLDAWRRIETMVWVGHIESAHAPLPNMQFKLEQKRPNKTRLQISALGEKSMRVFDGEHGWKLRPGEGRPEVRPYTAQESEFARAGHGIDGPLIDHAAKGNPVTLEGVDEVQGRKAYHLRVHLAKGGDEDVWVDTETYLELRFDRMADDGRGARRRVSASYGDYRSVEGLQIPFLIQTGGEPGTKPDAMHIEGVELNARVDDSAFASPTASHQRYRVGPSGAALGPAATTPPAAPRAAGDAPVSVSR